MRKNPPELRKALSTTSTRLPVSPVRGSFGGSYSPCYRSRAYPRLGYRFFHWIHHRALLISVYT